MSGGFTVGGPLKCLGRPVVITTVVILRDLSIALATALADAASVRTSQDHKCDIRPTPQADAPPRYKVIKEGF